MSRIIKCQVDNEYIRGGGVVIGSEGSGESVTLELAFNSAWDGYTKRLIWYDALGEHHVVQILTADLLVSGTNTYQVLIPPEACAVAGDAMLTIRGVTVDPDTGETLSCFVGATVTFKVLEGKWTASLQDMTASQAEQLQAQIDALLPQIVLAGQVAENEKERLSAEETRVQNELTRQQNETDRVSNEEARVKAEQERVDENNGIVAQATNQANAAQKSAENAASSEKSAADSATSSANSANLAANAQQAAENAAGAAEEHSTAAQLAMTEAENQASNSAGSAKESKSWAVGGTGSRQGEDTNNAQYWCEQAQTAAIVDSTLTISGAPADAKVVGDAIRQLQSDVSGKVDGIWQDPDSGLWYLTSNGEPVGEGIKIASDSGGLAFDSGYVDESGYLHLTMGGEDLSSDVFTPFFVGTGGTGGGGTGSTMKLTSRMASRTFSVMDTAASVDILYTWSSVDSEDGSATGNGSASWYVGGTRVAVQTVAQGDQSFDIKPYLTAGAANTVKLTLEDAYGASRSLTFTVTVTSYGLTWNLGKMADHGTDSLTLRLVPTGQGSKVLHVTVDGEEVRNSTVATSGRTITVAIQPQSHGAHTILAWLEITVDGQAMTTEALRHVGLWQASGNTTPVVAVYDPAPTVAQFGTASLLYMVFDPASETANITQSEDGSTLSVLTVDRSVQTWAYRASKSGVRTLAITCGTVSAEITLTVTASGYDIQPVTNGLCMDLDPAGHSNAEAGRENFGYKDADGTNHPLTFSANFDWINGGFRQDEEGVTALLIKRGSSVTLDRSLFDDNARTNGKCIKIIFKAAKVRKYAAEVASCWSGNVGLRLQANQATLGSELEKTVIPYCQDRKIEADFNINSASETKLATVWLRGVMSRVRAYSTGDSWQQTAPSALVIGSADCDVWLYRVKMYSNSLTSHEILDNFIADCGDPDDMIRRYVRNDIYNTDGTINLQQLSEVNPDLRVIRITADRMTTGKSDEVTATVELIYANGGKEYAFTATGVIMKAQGTSSLEYGLAALNLDLDFKSATWTRGDGETITEYAMTPDSIPVNYLNVKLNVASSENANNVILADRYNRFQPWLSPARRADSRVRDTVQGVPCAVFFTNNSSGTITVGARTVAAGETILYGAGDMNNSKKNYAVFGQDNSQWPEQCCVEVLNNNNAQCRFQSDDLSAETWDGDGNFEFRFPKKPTDAMKAAWQTVLSWVVSTDRTAATGNALAAPVIIGSETFANDTAEYRAAKFRAELADHFIVESLLYHYLFTERHCMVDSRAKNTFYSYEYDPGQGKYLWNICKNYDDDTAEGTDNSGGQTFRYGLEDTDTVGSANVFNASDSVLWTNIRDLMVDELQAMYRDRENKGTWSAGSVLADFSAHQAARPEALVNEDQQGKYIAPYENSGESRYLGMAQGTKEDMRDQFETYQETYCASKYDGSAATASRISLRGSAPGDWAGVKPTGDMTIKPYSDLYVTVKYGNAGTVRVRAKAGEANAIMCPADTLNDTEIYIYSARQITDAGDLAGIYTKLMDAGDAAVLQKIVLGSGEAGYTNGSLTSFSAGTNDMVEYLDLRGTPNLTQALDLSALDALTECYLSGSGVTGVTFAKGAPVRIAKLPAVTSLVARGLTQLESWLMDGSNLVSIWVEGSPMIDTLAACKAAKNLARGRLTDVDWTDENADVLLRLASLGTGSGIDSQGNTVDGFVLTGKAHLSVVTEDELATLAAAFPDLTVSYDGIVTSHTATFQNYDSTVLNTQTVRHSGAAVNPVTAGLCEMPTKPSTVEEEYTYIGWDKSLENIVSDTVFTAQFSAKTRVYTIRIWLEPEEQSLLKTVQVEARGSYAWDGDDLTSADGKLWMGFDHPMADVTSDLDVHAVFITPTLPDAVASGYDYLYSDNPADNSGYTLEQFCGIIKNKKEKDYFQLKDRIKITPNTDVFADSEIICEVAGFNHMKLADGSGTFAGVIWGMIGAMNASGRMNSTNTNAGGWPATEARDIDNNTIFPALPRWIRMLIPKVIVLSSAGATKADIVSSQDYLFRFSHAEVGFDVSVVPYCNEVDADAESVQLPIFTDNSSRIRKTYNGTGSAVNWWLRSPNPGSSTHFRHVGSTGGANSYAATYGFSVVLGFCTYLA